MSVRQAIDIAREGYLLARVLTVSRHSLAPDHPSSDVSSAPPVLPSNSDSSKRQTLEQDCNSSCYRRSCERERERTQHLTSHLTISRQHLLPSSPSLALDLLYLVCEAAASLSLSLPLWKPRGNRRPVLPRFLR